jgi:adenosylmethionine-8-amino-7-oxononanoate aminotransferase
MDVKKLREMDVAHLLHPVTPLAEHEKRGPTVIVSGKGPWVRDAEGHELIDGFSGLWCVNAGYGEASIVEAARAQMEALPYASSFSHFANAPSIELAAELAELAPEGLDHVFFTLGGSDAVETALKIARYHHSVRGEPDRQHFIALERGYHGSAFAGAGMTALPIFHGHFGLPFEFQHHIPSHDAYRNPAGPDPEAIVRSSLSAFEAKVAEVGVGRIAAFIAEPIQGAGGIVVPPRGWLSALREACRAHGILFIADEVITGFGRTGTPFGCDHERVAPDLMTLAKGLTSGYAPMGATLVSDAIHRSLVDDVPPGTVFGHGFTYGGHPVSAAVGLAALRLYRERLFAQVERVAPHFQARLGMLADHPLVGDVRGRGLLGALELVEDKPSKRPFDAREKIGPRVHAAAYRAGLLCRVMGDTIGFAPPFCCEEADIDVIVARISRALEEVQAERARG